MERLQEYVLKMYKKLKNKIICKKKLKNKHISISFIITPQPKK